MVFEPKWDGYRVLAYGTGDGRARLLSRRGTDLTDGFPDIADAVAVIEEDLVVDGEVVIHREGRLDFGALQRRLGRTTAAARQLAVAEPAHLVVFDLLQRGQRRLVTEPYQVRRSALEELFAERRLGPPWTLCPSTTDRSRAEEWMIEWSRVGIEGVVAKGAGQRYEPGRRGWLKVKSKATADAIVGAITGRVARPDTVLLGRHDQDGVLRLVARSTPLAPELRDGLGRLLTAAGPSHPWAGARFTVRWGSREPLTFTTVQPSVVVEFAGDAAIDHGRWRHPVRALRHRPDLTSDDVPPLQ
ncbi:ATP-dependent DNA ligase [Streptomyces sp. 8K308]|nr:ATP-dependent DNA ligase [Streptomyces sp. 8K308]